MVERCSDHQVFFTETQTTLCLQLSLEELLNLMQLCVNPPKQKKYTNRRLFFYKKHVTMQTFIIELLLFFTRGKMGRSMLATSAMSDTRAKTQRQ